MEIETMSDGFWNSFFTASPVLLAVYLLHLRQMRSIAANTVLTKQTNQTSNAVGVAVVKALDKVDSATRGQKENLEVVADVAANKAAAAAGIIAKTVARKAEETATTAATTAKNVAEKVSTDIGELKEALNGRLSEKLEAAHRAGYALGIQDKIFAKVEDHAQRIGGIETRLDRIDGKLTTVLDKPREQVRGESR